MEKKEKKIEKHRKYRFTDFKLREEYNWEKISYAIWQLEKCPTTDRLHNQGYMELNTPCTMKQIEKKYPGINLGICNGTQEDNIKYCSKEQTRIKGPFEYGKKKEQGKRNDLESIKELLLNGKSTKDISESHFGAWCKYNKSFDRFVEEHIDKSNREKPEVIVYWGPPGSGKTRRADEESRNAYWKAEGKWWDGYNYEPEIILDDFYGEIEYSQFLKILDRYGCRVETKGGTRWIHAKKIIITSNKKPENWYPNVNPAAILRRIDKCIYLGLGTEVAGNNGPPQDLEKK